MKAVQVVISGRVQGVGYRAWLAEAARAAGLDGWVRNRRDGRVEALLAGGDAAVDAMVAACRNGPRSASVEAVAVAAATLPGAKGFAVLPTA
jgi:acylphosphatase